MNSPFTDEYYLRGPQTGLSNYRDYRWIPELTIPAAKSVVKYLGISPGETILDWGCARGYYVRAYWEIGFKAWGYDISDWAIANCDPSVREHVSTQCPLMSPYWIIAKDVLEHVQYTDLKKTIRFFLEGARKGILICVPLADAIGGPYILDVDNRDSTHVIAWTFEQWVEFLQQQVDDTGFPFLVSGAFRLPGLKEYDGRPHNGCGFFTLRRYTRTP